MKISQLLFVLALSASCFSITSVNVFAADKPLATSLSDQAKQAIVAEDLESASDKISEAIEASPSDAKLFKIAGDIFITRAQTASVFSAPGLAKKGLKSYKKAVALEPDNAHYRLMLMQFYLGAPGIVGGDKDLGAEQAAKIQSLDPIKGVVANAILHRNSEDLDAQKRVFEQLDEQLSQEPQVKLEQALYLAASKQPEKAIIILNELSDLQPSSLKDADDQLVPYKAMLQTGFLGLSDERYLPDSSAAFIRYLDQAPAVYRLASKNWVRYFLGQSYQKAKKTALAKQTYEQVKRDTKDKALLKQLKSAFKDLR